MSGTSYSNGAKTVIGWQSTIKDFDANHFLLILFSALYAGNTVLEASRVAAQCEHYVQAATIIGALVIGGDEDNCLFPIQQATEAGQMSSTFGIEFDKTQYTLTIDNKYCRTRLYTKMLNGVPTDDFFLEYYNDNGEVTSIWKSAFVLNEAVAMRIEREHADILNTMTIVEKENLVYTFINGEIYLTKRQDMNSEQGYYVDVVSGSMLT